MRHQTQLIVNRIASVWSLLLIALMAFTLSAQAAEKDAHTAWEMINNGALVVDVRTAEEFAQGHLDNAINIPFENISNEFKQRGIAKDQAVVVYCRSGRRSGIAQQSLIEQGYGRTYNGGGLESLAAHNKQ
ncbi:rhodanese-like domain-containing protein [Shewanella colwelliana]|uniref:Rhodanese n=2 Tax=Shewanella colwelliana TaxID=23 RepID=A0A1E5IXK1_SHECO|nr:rhodanese [Shewanella colwelliana]GIU36399.1 sulfurtransferase [Shewanella colwelliana]